MTLLADERNALVKYRKEKSLKTLKEAKDVASLEHWSLTVQRLYYATYYAQSALLIKAGNQASTHAGVKALVNLNFVKTGALSKEEGNLLGRLFSMRQSGDYEDSFEWTREDVEPLIGKTETLINKILGLVDQ